MRPTGVGEPEPLEQRVGPAGGGPRVEVGESAGEAQVAATGEVGVYRSELPGQADAAAHVTGLADDVEARHGGVPGVGSREGGEGADGGGLARAVGPEQAQDRARLDVQVDAVEGLHGTEGLAEVVDVDHGFSSGPGVGPHRKR